MFLDETRICRFCGDTFYSERNTAKFCQDKPCKTKWHMERRQRVQTPLKRALRAINELGLSYEGRHSYEAALALKRIIIMASDKDKASSNTWWRCRKCGDIKQSKFPSKGECPTGSGHEWRYQSEMFKS